MVSPPFSFARLVRPGYGEYSARARRRAWCTKRSASARLDAAFARKRASRSVFTYKQSRDAQVGMTRTTQWKELHSRGSAEEGHLHSLLFLWLLASSMCFVLNSLALGGRSLYCSLGAEMDLHALRYSCQCCVLVLFAARLRANQLSYGVPLGCVELPSIVDIYRRRRVLPWSIALLNILATITPTTQNVI